MYEVRDTVDARRQLQALPLVIRARVLAVYERLAHWPEVSGAKALAKELRGGFRVRTGDYRVLFTVDQATQRITIFRIANRRDVYE